MKLCCDCRVSEGISSEKIVWYLPEPKQQSSVLSSRKKISGKSFISTSIQSPKSYVTLPKAKLNLSHFRSQSGSTTDLSLPREKSQDESTLSVDNVKQLKRQNSQYVNIIKTQLYPLKRDYNILLDQYKKKNEVISFLDKKLREIQNTYYANPGNIKMIPDTGRQIHKSTKKVWRV